MSFSHGSISSCVKLEVSAILPISILRIYLNRNPIRSSSLFSILTLHSVLTFSVFFAVKTAFETGDFYQKPPFLIVFKGQRPLCHSLLFLELFVSMVKRFSIFHFRQKSVFAFSDISLGNAPKSCYIRAFDLTFNLRYKVENVYLLNYLLVGLSHKAPWLLVLCIFLRKLDTAIKR